MNDRMNEESWRARVEFNEQRFLEKSRECALQHIALGKIMDVVDDSRASRFEGEAQDIVRELDAILKPYREFLQRFHMAAWAIWKDEPPDQGGGT